ncbi:MAG: hypothetical protein IPM39_24950 [Chloroflexi bacterium]|nr:hypothetical protein [Chloroflexota bacterium]
MTDDTTPPTTGNLNATGWHSAIAAELGRLTSPLQVKTVTAVITARLNGEPYDTDAFWGRPDTCSRSTWNKWKKHDRAFNSVLERAWDITKSWQTEEATNAIERASTMLQLAAPDMAKGVITLASGLDERGRLVKHADRLRAMLSALDRASSTTAPKGQVEVRGLEEALARIYGDEEENA